MTMKISSYAAKCVVRSTLLVCMLLPVFSPLYGKEGLLLADQGKSRCIIVESANATPAEKRAAQELKTYLEKVTGAVFKIQTESSVPPARALYVGQTRFARQKGIDFTRLSHEEWIIKSSANNLILSGGRPRGTLYAVYEFLEQQAGCRWFDEFTEAVPVRKQLRIPALSIQSKPAFFGRQIGMGKPIVRDSRELILLRARNKDTRNTCGAEFGFGENITSHSFYSYSRNFPADKKNFLAMYYDGSRPVSVNGSGPGQICLTDPGARQAVLKQVKAALAAFYKQNDKSRSVVIPLMPNDKAWCCQCAECQKIVKREKADSGALLYFVNAIAAAIEKEYPNALISTAAYLNNVEPPQHIRPRKNVMIEIAQLNAEWGTSAKQKREYPDLFRPLTHPVNKSARTLFETWARISPNLETWDYWVEWTDKFPTPYVVVNTIASDIKFFNKCKVKRIYVEHEYFRNSPCFHALTTWTGWKLMQDPRQDVEKLISVFMSGYYGPAGAKMHELLKFMEKSIAELPLKVGNMSAMTPSQRPYLTLNFYRTGQKLLDEAEKLCPPGSKYLLNVQKERIPFDAGLYCMWEQLKKQLPKGTKMPWNQAAILKRYENNCLRQAKVRWPSSLAKTTKTVEQHVTLFKGLAADRSGKKPPIIPVPFQKKSANGKVAAVDWDQAVSTPVWTTTVGSKAPCSVSAAFTRDREFLYIQMEEKSHGQLKTIWWSGDIWELFFSSKRSGRPYKQLAFNSAGETHAYDYTVGRQGWKIQGLDFKSELSNGTWRVRCALPLKALMSEKDIREGQGVFLNIFRHVTAASTTVSLSPVYEASYHDMARLAELRLDPQWPADGANLFKGKSYTLSIKPSYARCADPATELKKLTDGKFTPAKRPVWLEKNYTVGYAGGKPEITVDMGAVKEVDMVYYHTGAGLAGVEPPPRIQVYASCDNRKFDLIGEIRNESTFAGGYRPLTIGIPVKKSKARYIRVVVSGTYFIFCDELGASCSK